jgi:hypothetical protein
MLEGQNKLMAGGNALQDMYDAQEAIQQKDNLFNQHFDRNQAEYSAPLFQGDPIQAAIDLEYPGATQITDFVDAMDGDTNAYKKILAQDGQISSGRGGIPVEMPIISDGDSENIFQNQDVDADAYQRALEKDRYQTQINNPTADFSGTMKNYGSGFKSHEPQARLSDVSSATPMQLAGSGSTLSGDQLNTRHPAYQAMLDRQANEAENIFQTQDVGADAYQRALEKDRYQTQINNPTADFSGTMKNYGSGFKSHEPQARLSDVSSATPMQLAGSGSTLSGDQLNTRHPAYQAMLAREINEAENLFQNQDIGFPVETRGSFAGSSAGLGATKDGPKTSPSGWTASTVKDSDVYSAAIDDSMEVLGSDGMAGMYLDGTPMQLHKGKLLGAIKDGPKTGPSSTNATDVKLENLVEQMETGGSGYLNSLKGLPLRLLTGGDVTEKAINQHIINKSEDYGDGLAGYMDESSDGYKAVSGNPYHIRSGRDVGNLSGDKNLPLGGIPAALGGYAYQQLSEGAKDFGVEGLLQATDNARGLALSGNAPAVQSIFDFVDSASDNIAAGKERDAVIKKEIKEKTFTPRVVAPKKKVEAKKKKTTPKRVTVNYNKNKPVKVKSKPSRTPVPKVTRTTGSRGGRGNVSKKKKTYTSRGRW